MYIKQSKIIQLEPTKIKSYLICNEDYINTHQPKLLGCVGCKMNTTAARLWQRSCMNVCI